jgi:hypothetical protein
MPEDNGERIRKLKFPPAPAWGDRGPRTKTLRGDIARWYENVPGGLDAAVAQAQAAVRENGGRPWNPAMLDEPSPAVFKELDRGLGYHNPRTDELALTRRFLSDPYQRQTVLEHERSHRLYGEPMDDASVLPGEAQWLNSESGAQYVTKPSEIEVRVADMKRKYAHATGRLVDSPEEARRAIIWYGKNFEDMPTEGPDASKSGKNIAREYLSLPEEERERLFRRMMEVVQANSPQRFLG